MKDNVVPLPHGKKCGAKTRSGGTCGKPAGWGTESRFGRCRLHGGATPSGKKNAEKQQAEAAVEFYGLPREIDPHSALVEELHRTAGHVAFLGTAIREGEIKAEQTPTGKRRKVPFDGAFGGPSLYVALYQQERKHFTEIAKTCIAVGIEERRVQLAEQQGELIASLIRAILTDCGLKPDDPEVRGVVRRHLSAVPDAA